jgi:hypothetical protein
VKLSLSADWYEFLCALADHRVRFLIVGGHAVSAHGEPRFTKDLDILVEPTRANGARLHAALTEFGLGAIAPRPEELAAPGPFWMFGRPPVRIDVMTEITGVPFRTAWKNRVRLQLDAQHELFVIGRADLITAKRAAGRPQDLADVAMLESQPAAAPGPAKRGSARRRR